MHCVAERLVAGYHRVAAVPGGPGFGIQPEQVSGSLPDGLQDALGGVVVVGAGIAEHDDGGAPAHLLAPALPERLQRVAVIRPAVQPYAAAHGVEMPGGIDDVRRPLQDIGYLVDAVDEYEAADTGELRTQREHELQGERGERGNGAGD